MPLWLLPKQQLESLLKDYLARVSKVTLDMPRVEGLAQPEKSAAKTARSIALKEPEPFPEPAASRATIRVLKELSQVGDEPRRRWRWIGLLAGAILVAAGLAVPAAKRWYAQFRTQLHHAFPLSYTNTTALTANDGMLYTLDPQRRLLFTFSADDMQIRAVQKFSRSSINGLAWANDYFWSTNAEAGHIYEHAMDALSTIRKTYANPQSRPSAVYWDGKHLWVSDLRTETIYQYSVGDTLIPVKQFTLSGIVPAGIHHSENHLWILDAPTRTMHRYRIGGLLKLEESFDFSGWLPPECRVTGFAVDGSHFWLITQNPAATHRFDRRYLALVPEAVRSRFNRRFPARR